MRVFRIDGPNRDGICGLLSNRFRKVQVSLFRSTSAAVGRQRRAEARSWRNRHLQPRTAFLAHRSRLCRPTTGGCPPKGANTSRVARRSTALDPGGRSPASGKCRAAIAHIMNRALLKAMRNRRIS